MLDPIDLAIDFLTSRLVNGIVYSITLVDDLSLIDIHSGDMECNQILAYNCSMFVTYDPLTVDHGIVRRVFRDPQDSNTLTVEGFLGHIFSITFTSYSNDFQLIPIDFE